MIHIRHTLIGFCVVAASAGVLAQGTVEHKNHHPAEAATPAAAPTPATAPSSQIMNPDMMAAMEQRMRVMHEKMAAARTPQERQALMAEHMKTMRDGMHMMGAMRGRMAPGSPPAGMAGMQYDPQMMEKRMDMMESMMQMMMDRMSMPQASTPGSK
jgi:hypothetical protein